MENVFFKQLIKTNLISKFNKANTYLNSDWLIDCWLIDGWMACHWVRSSLIACCWVTVQGKTFFWITKTGKKKIPQGKKLDNIYRCKGDDISFPKRYKPLFNKFFPSKFEILQDYTVEYSMEYSPVEFRQKNRFDGKNLLKNETYIFKKRI